MPRKSQILCLLATLTLVAFLSHRPAVGNGGAAGYSTDVQVTKSEKYAGAYAVRVQLHNLATGELVAAPQIIARGGDRAEVESALPDNSACRVTATIDPVAKTATYSVVVTKGGSAVAEHKAKVTIE
jgi:hypothetical protein